jgi:DNA-3-methyladenine glycosylase
LPRSFYARSALAVAEDLIGKILVVRPAPGSSAPVRVGRIVETEAYQGPDDLAAHSRGGLRTSRTEIMFGPAGHAYVYFIYGMHHCLNVVTAGRGVPHAVLIRAVEPIQGIEQSMQGPGLVCRALGITRADNGLDFRTSRIRIESGAAAAAAEVRRAPRINVAYAGAWAALPWRFFEFGSPYVSRDENGRIPSRRPLARDGLEIQRRPAKTELDAAHPAQSRSPHLR